MDIMNLISFLLVDICASEGGLGPVIKLATNVVKILQFAIPIALIIYGMIDLGKAVIAGKEDEMKKAQGTLLKRFIYAVLIFFVVILVNFVIGLVSDTGVGTDKNWLDCWNACWSGNCDGEGASGDGE